MTLESINISFVGMEPTDSLRKYFLEKIGKYKYLWSDAISMEVVLRENINTRGVKNDFRIDINVSLSRSSVRVEVVGPDMFANIDEATDTLARRLKRYRDKKMYWEGSKPWRVLDDEEPVKVQDDDYSNYVPRISVRKKIVDMSPLEEGEAIERMELLGYDQLLFRSKSTGKISMIYKRKNGDYGLVEPKDSGIE
jgi:putative sigma-54 modulation protein